MSSLSSGVGRGVAMSATAASTTQGARVFQTSLTSRRFPALRTLTAEDVEVMVMPAGSPKKGGTAAESHLFDPNLVKPSAVSSLGNARAPKAGGSSAAAAAAKKRPPFTPCCPSEARDTITVERHGYVSIHSPYDNAHRLQLLEREEAEKLVLGGKYDPNAWSKARKEIEVNYFLNSPDAETIEAERRYIREKANRNMVDYYRRMHANLSLQRDTQS